MSRRLERFGPTPYADNSLNTVLTAPAGEKFEVVELWIETLGAAGSTLAWYLQQGAAYSFLDLLLATTAGTYVWRARFDSAVIYSGESLAVVAYAVGGFYSAFGSYIVVDPG